MKNWGLGSSLDFYHLQGTDNFSVDPIYSLTFYYIVKEDILKFYRQTKTDTETEIIYSTFQNLCKAFWGYLPTEDDLKK